MANNETLLGIGLATGMFYHAPAGTELPATPYSVLGNDWKKIGDISDAGIGLSTDRTTQNIKNWANQIKRVLLTDHAEKIKAPIMDTTEEVLKTVLGSENVEVEQANDQHGKVVKASLSDGTLPAPEAFIFLMKDGDDMLMLGCKEGQITSMDEVTFAPGSAITWSATITAMGEGWKLIMDDGQKLAQ